MSQRENKFQSKSRFGGGKGKGGDFKGRGKPGGGFGKKFEGDRPRRDGEDRPRKFTSDRPKRDFGDKPAGKRSFGDKPRGSFGDKPRGGFGGKPRFDREDRPKRDFGDKPRFDREDRPKRDFGDKPRGGFGDKPRSGFGGKPRFDREDRPKRDFGDKPRGGFGGKPRFDREDRPKRDFGDKPRGGFGDREFKPRDRDGGGFDRKPREGGFERRPREGGFDRKPRDGGFDRKPRDGGFDRKPRGEGDFDRKPRFDRDGAGDRPRPRGNDKSFKRYGDKPGFDRKPRRDSRSDVADAGPAVEATFETKQKLKSERSNFGAPSSAFLYGVHAVSEALKNPKRLHQRLLCTQRGYEAIAEAFQEAADEGNNMPQVVYVEKEDIDRLLPRDAVHQDILLDCQPLEEIFLADILVAEKDNENAKILVLDQVTDPHNVGAIMRSAAAFGAVAVVAQKLHAPDITGIVAKAASGAVEHVPLVKETNLSRVLEQLKEAGYFCIGLAEEGKMTLASLKLTGRVALVLGAEGDGLRRLVSEKCDELVHLPTQGEIGSLNVSNAAAVALYELVRK